MTMAVEAGVPGAENTEWARTTLGDLYLNNGNPDSASIIYRSSLVYRPSYPYALIGMAKVAKVKKDYASAMAYTRQAIATLSDQAFVSLLADIYELQGDEAKATEVRNDVVTLLEESKNKDAGALATHNVNRELATAYLHAGKLDKALTYAAKDLEMRPNNIDANELTAWIYYMKGDYANARKHIDKAFVTNIKNAETLYKAAAIYGKSGLQAKSNDLMQTAVAINPFIGEYFANQAKYKTAITKM
jgi:tetratricopeptide (TPR) repeat protein